MEEFEENGLLDEDDKVRPAYETEDIIVVYSKSDRSNRCFFFVCVFLNSNIS